MLIIWHSEQKKIFRIWKIGTEKRTRAYKGKNRDNAIKSNSEDQKCEARFGSWFEVHC